MTLRPARAALLVLVLGAGAAQESGGAPDTEIGRAHV